MRCEGASAETPARACSSANYDTRLQAHDACHIAPIRPPSALGLLHLLSLFSQQIDRRHLRRQSLSPGTFVTPDPEVPAITTTCVQYHGEHPREEEKRSQKRGVLNLLVTEWHSFRKSVRTMWEKGKSFRPRAWALRRNRSH